MDVVERCLSAPTVCTPLGKFSTFCPTTSLDSTGLSSNGSFRSHSLSPSGESPARLSISSSSKPVGHSIPNAMRASISSTPSPECAVVAARAGAVVLCVILNSPIVHTACMIYLIRETAKVRESVGATLGYAISDIAISVYIL